MKLEDLNYLLKVTDDAKAQEILAKTFKKEQKKKSYKRQLTQLQVELLKLQDWVHENQTRLVIIFEGRDGAGKGSTIKRFIEHMNPRKFRIVALPKPTPQEQKQFFYQRYLKQLPNAGEIVFFDRSWYNRAIVEPTFGFCTKEQYEQFMQITPQVEKALIDDGIIIIKFWLSITKQTQAQRFYERQHNPLKYWKLSPIDLKAQELWDVITQYKERMFEQTSTPYAPWVIVDSNKQKQARVNTIKYVLSQIPYEGKDSSLDLSWDPKQLYLYKKD